MIVHFYFPTLFTIGLFGTCQIDFIAKILFVDYVKKSVFHATV